VSSEERASTHIDDTEQHSLWTSILLHLLPGIGIPVFFVVVTPVDTTGMLLMAPMLFQ